MTPQESHRATVEARRAAGKSAAPVSGQETALRRYLSATAYESMSTAPEVHRPAPVAESGAAPNDASPRTATIPTADPVIAGVDGSRCARNAAYWAAAEASRRHLALHLVHAYHLPPGGFPGYNPYPPHLLADLRDEGAAILADTVGEVRRQFPDLSIDSALVYGDPATVLRHASATASLTVVGNHGTKRSAVSLGSVAAEIARTAPVPVAVIHSARPPGTGPVVVGVDGSPTSEAAIGFAFDAAAARKAKLVALHCWTDPGIDGPLPLYASEVVDPQRIQEVERTRLSEELARWTTKYPDVQVEQAVIHESPGVGLLEYAPSAQLIVAGNRGHNAITGMLLGSTSRALIAHSPCPVVIVRPAPTR
jgi:nucleotide-binding universal stress UspA family protein